MSCSLIEAKHTIRHQIASFGDRSLEPMMKSYFGQSWEKPKAEDEEQGFMRVFRSNWLGVCILSVQNQQSQDYRRA